METEEPREDPFTNEFGIPAPSADTLSNIFDYKRHLWGAIEEQRVALDEVDDEVTREEGLAKRRRWSFEKNSRISLSKIDKLIANRESQFPQWMQPLLTRIESQMGELKGNIIAMKTELKGDIRELKTTVDHMDDRLRGVMFSTAITENRNRKLNGFPLQRVPFIVGEGPDDDVPVIQNVESIDNISREHCEYLLRGYGITFGRNENVNLKNRLRDIFQFNSPTDLRLVFHPF